LYTYNDSSLREIQMKYKFELATIPCVYIHRSIRKRNEFLKHTVRVRYSLSSGSRQNKRNKITIRRVSTCCTKVYTFSFRISTYISILCIRTIYIRCKIGEAQRVNPTFALWKLKHEDASSERITKWIYMSM
jgi:hypothetical protein